LRMFAQDDKAGSADDLGPDRSLDGPSTSDLQLSFFFFSRSQSDFRETPRRFAASVRFPPARRSVSSMYVWVSSASVQRFSMAATSIVSADPNDPVGRSSSVTETADAD